MRIFVLFIMMTANFIYADQNSQDRFDDFENEVEMTEEEIKKIEYSELSNEAKARLEEGEDEEDFESLDLDELPDALRKKIISRFDDQDYEIAHEVTYFIVSKSKADYFVSVYDQGGELIEKEEYEPDEDFEEEFEIIKKNELPEAVLNSVNQELKDLKLKIGLEDHYLLFTEENNKEVLYIFSREGSLLEKEIIEED